MIRKAFVKLNRWGNHLPCPDCRPDGYDRPPGKDMDGVCTLHGLDRKTDELVYYCLTCNKEVTRPATNATRKAAMALNDLGI